MLSVSGSAIGQSFERYPWPVIGYESRLACQIEVPKMQNDVEEPGICLKACEGSTATYYVSGFDGSHFQWAVTGGTIQGGSSGTTVTVQWGDAGSGMLSVTETTIDSLSQTVYQCVELVDAPTAHFTILPTPQDMYCTGQDVFFQDLSIAEDGNIIAWLWDFGDGTYSSEQNPIHQWERAGVYRVRLSVFNECNCVGMFLMDVRIGNGDPVEITCPSVVCEGHTATYTVHSNCSGGKWTVRGGTIVRSQGRKTTVVWDKPQQLIDGFGLLSVSTSSCDNTCSKSAIVKVPVVTDTAIISGEAGVCEGRQYKYSLPAWPATVFEWEVNKPAVAEIVAPAKGKDIYVNVKQEGSFVLTVRYHNTLTGCSGMAQKVIQSRPVASIVSNDWDGSPQCKHSTLTFQHTIAGNAVAGRWVLQKPDGSTQSHNGSQFTHTYSQGGLYTLSVGSDNYCSPDAIQIVVYDTVAPVNVVTGPREVCAGISYSYTADSAVAGTEYVWSAVNGSVLQRNGNTAIVVWDAFPAQLIVQRRQLSPPFCLSDSTIVMIVSLADADYHIEQFGSGHPYPNCRRTYRLMKGNVPFSEASNYEWMLGSNAIASMEDNYNSILTVQAHGVVDTSYTELICKFDVCDTTLYDTLQIAVLPMPMPVVSAPDTVCPDTEIFFTVLNSGAYDSFSWRWSGGVASGATASMRFFNTDTVACRIDTLYLEARACGNKITWSKPIVIHPDMGGVVAVVWGRLYVYTSSPSLFVWEHNGQEDFGQESSVPIEDPDQGVYTCVVTHPETGCRKVFEHVCSPSMEFEKCVFIELKEPPLCGVMTLHAEPSNFSNYSWNGDYGIHFLSPADLCDVNCVADTAGVYTIRASLPDGTLEEPCGHSASIVVTVPLVADIGVEYRCDAANSPYLIVTDKSTSYPSNVPRTTVLEQFSNGRWDVLSIPKIINNVTPGSTYQFRLTTQLQDESYSCTKDTIYTIPSFPSAAFAVSDSHICENVPIQLTANNTSYQQYIWDLDDSAFATSLSTLPRTFSNIDSISERKVMSLQVLDEYGCMDKDSVTIIVYDNRLGGNIGYDPTVVCYGNTVTLYFDNDSVLPDYYQWMPGDVPVASLSATLPTLYTLTVSDTNRCQYRMGPDGANIIVPTPPVIIGNKDICLGDEMTLYGLANGDTVSYRWYRMPDSTVSIGNGERLTVVQSAAETIVYRLQVTYANGCSAYQDDTVRVHALPSRPQVTSTHLSCSPYSFRLNVTNSVSGDTYAWSNGSEGVNTTVVHGGAYAVTHIDEFGCEATSGDIRVPLSPETYAWTFPVGCYAFCPQELPRHVYGPVYLLDANAQELWQWAWLRNNAVQSSGSGFTFNDYGLDPPLTINAAGDYSMLLSNGMCVDTVATASVSILDGTECGNCNFGLGLLSACLRPDGTVQVVVELVNASDSNLNYLLSDYSSAGVFYNAQGVMQTDTHIYTHILYPDSSLHVGSSIMGQISVWYPEPLNIHCQEVFKITITDSCGANADNGMEALSLSGDSVQAAIASSLRLYPNPTHDGVWIEFSSGEVSDDEEEGIIVVRNILGEVVATSAIVADGGPIYLSTTGFAAGVYTVEYRQEGRLEAVKKLVKQ